jgi:endonuclease-3 related protein
VDSYTRRLFDRLRLLPLPSYDDVQTFCHERLPADPTLYNEFHALIVRHSVTHCRAKPRCVDCPLAKVCPSCASK